MIASSPQVLLAIAPEYYREVESDRIFHSVGLAIAFSPQVLLASAPEYSRQAQSDRTSHSLGLVI